MISARFAFRLSVTLCSLAICLILGGLASGENWPGWRGPNSNAVSSEKDLADTWSAEQGLRWRTSLPGSGISSPIIWGERVFLTASDGRDQSELHIICLSRRDGRQLWHVRLWGTAPTLRHATKSSMASPTPVTDGKHVYCLFGTGDLFCVDMTGHMVWSRSLATEYGRFENRFAYTSSPLLYRDLILLQCDHFGDSYVVGIDKQTGADRWKVDRPGVWHSWSSPTLTPVGQRGEHELIVCSSQKIDALNPLTGRQLWTVAGMRRECIPSPVSGHGLIYAVSGPKGPTLAIRPGGRGDVTDTRVVWENNRGAPFVPSAILVGDLYYLVDDQGVCSCLDAHSGSRVWQKRLPGKFTASPIAGDGKIYFVSETGETFVLRSGVEKFEQVSRNALGEPVYSSPAISQGDLFIRTARGLFCIGASSQE